MKEHDVGRMMATRYEEDLFKLERGLDAARLDPNPLASLYTATSASTAMEVALKRPSMADMIAEVLPASYPTLGLKVADMLGRYNPTADLVQAFTPASAYALGVGALTPFWQHTDALNYPLSQSLRSEP